MNRISNEYMAGRRNIPAVSMHRREKSLTGIPTKENKDENLDLFSRNRRSYTIASSDELEVSLKLERISLGSAKIMKSGMDDLLSSVDGGKHDYDWLLTPPGTPLFPSSDANEPQPTAVSRRSGSLARSVSTTKASRLSVSQSENNYPARPTRSSSVTRPSISTASYNTYSNSNRSSSMLNTSMSSVTSISRPSTPNSRSTSRPSSPSAHSIPSRPSTSVKSRPLSTSFSGERTRASQSPRPSTPNSRPQIPANLNSLVPRSTSRPSTPTRRTSAQSLAPVTGRSASAGRVIANDRNVQPTSRGSSPGPRARPTHQPIVLPDFPLDIPPNLRTTLPDRPISAGRSRPGATVTGRGNSEATRPITPQRRQSSPVITRGRPPELSGKNRLYANGHDNGAYEDRRMTPASELPQRRVTKPATTIENTGYGRTISKKFPDTALRHTDIRPGTGSIRPVSGSTLFPQSIRSGKPKGRSAHMGAQAYSGGQHIGNYVGISKNGNYIIRPQDGEYDDDDGHFSAKLSEPDIYESSRYNAILFTEDLKSTNWLHSFDEKSDQGSIFDHKFEPLPEPFGPL